MTLADVVLAKKWELDALRHALRPGALLLRQICRTSTKPRKSA